MINKKELNMKQVITMNNMEFFLLLHQGNIKALNQVNIATEAFTKIKALKPANITTKVENLIKNPIKIIKIRNLINMIKEK